VLLLFEMLRARKTAPAQPAAKPREKGEHGAYLVIVAVVVWTWLYFLVFERLGYLLATPIFLFALMAYFNRGKWLANALTAVLFVAASYWLFKVLGVNLARGILPF
jgi:putative tricarboxylic transport membrane protein